MSRDANGNYTLPSGNPVQTGTTIDSSWANDTMNDLGNEITNSLDRFGKGGMSAPLRGVNGTVTVPSYSFTGETSSGFFLAGAGDFRLTVQGAERARFTASSVLIPDLVSDVTTANADAISALDDRVTDNESAINSNASAISSNTSAINTKAPIANPTFTGNVTIPDLILHTGDSNTFFGFSAADTFEVTTAGTERLRVASDGDVLVSKTGNAATTNGHEFLVTGRAIHTATDQRVLDLFRIGTDGEVLNLYNGGTLVGGLGVDGTSFTFFNTGTEAMRIDSAGDINVTGGRLRVTESDSSNDAVVLTRDTDEGFVNVYANNAITTTIRGAGSSFFNGGNVGIGTSSPTTKFNVAGTGDVAIRIDSDGNESALWFGNTNAGKVSVRSPAPLIFETGATEKVRIAANGNVGIGTSSPSFKLDVVDSGDVGLRVFRSDGTRNGRLEIKQDASGGVINQTYSTSADALRFENGNVEAMRITANRNVGIGETAPLAKLHVKTADTGISSLLANYDDFCIEGGGNVGMTIVSSASNNTGIAFADPNSNFQGGIVYAHSDNTLRFFTDGAEKFRVNALGSFGIGTASPQAKLDVDGDILANGKQVGYNNVDVSFVTSTGTLTAASNAYIRKATTSSITLTVSGSLPTGGVQTIVNPNASGVITLNAPSGDQLVWMNGSQAISGSVSIASGGALTLVRVSSSTIDVFGTGIS